jgi:hypothetical protein
VSAADDQFLQGSGLAKLFGGPIPHKTFEYEGCGGRFKSQQWAMRAPSALDHTQALSDARKFLESKGWRVEELQLGEVGAQAFELAAQAFVLARSLVEPNDPSKPFADSGEQVLRLLQVEEITGLFSLLTEYQAERSPLSSGALSLEKIDGVLDDLGKGLLAPTWWRSYASATLAKFTLRAADRLAMQMRGKSSPSGSLTNSIDAGSTEDE